jgi:hypothetical protein
MIPIKLASEFSRTPGGRVRSDGPHSGQEFREKFLEPAFLRARSFGDVVVVDLNGTYGYSTGFLDEVFGAMVRKYGWMEVWSHLRYFDTEDPFTENEIKDHMEQASREKDKDLEGQLVKP